MDDLNIAATLERIYDSDRKTFVGVSRDLVVIELQPIPASAQAIEERLRAIREQTTLSERMEAWRTFARNAA